MILISHSSQYLTHHSRAKVGVFTELWDNYLMNMNLILQSQKKYPGTKPRKLKHMYLFLIHYIEVAHNVATPGLNRHVIICCAYDSAWQESTIYVPRSQSYV